MVHECGPPSFLRRRLPYIQLLFIAQSAMTTLLTGSKDLLCFVRMSVQDPEPAVRFESQIEEIEPEHSLEEVRALTGNDDRRDLSPEAKQELRSLAVTMQACSGGTDMHEIEC